MAALTSTSRFASINVNFDEIRNIAHEISWELDDTDMSRGSIRVDPYPTSGQALTDLGVLHDINVSSDGFRDANGATITPTVNGNFVYGTTVESLDEFGSYNPLRAGSWEGYQDNLRIQGSASRGLIKHEGSGDTERIEQTIGHQVMEKQASGDNYDFPLNRWNVLQDGDDKVAFSIGLDSDANLDTVAKLNAYPPIKAFLSYINRKRTSGSVLGTDILSAATFSQRDFHIQQDPSDSDDLALTYGGVEHDRSEDDNYIYVSVEFVRETPGAAIDHAKLSQTILGETGTISTTDLMIPPPQGSPPVPFETSAILQDNHKGLIFRNSGMYYRGRHPVTGVPFEVPVMSGVGIPYDFSTLTTHGGVRQTPVDPFVTGVFYQEDVDDTLQFFRPRALLRTPGSRDIEIHNHTDDRNLTLRLWGTTIDHVMTVYPGEYVKFQSVLKNDGGEELIGIDIPERAMEHSAASSGTLGNLPVWDDGAYFLRPVRFGTSGNDFVHSDAFTIHSGSRPAAQLHGAIADYAGSFEFLGAWTVEMSGLMFVDYQYELIIDDAGANITGLNGPRLYRVRGTGNPTLVGELPQGTLTGDGATRSYNFNHVFRAEAGDLYFFMHGYITIAGGSDIEWENWTRKVELFPKIRRIT